MRKVLILLFLFLWPQIAVAAPEPEVIGQAALLMDYQTGQVLYTKEADTPMYPASTTKIMTAILALEKLHLDDVAVATERVREAYGTAIYLEPGEMIPVKDLLYALLVQSANDAAIVTAEKVSGSLEKFTELMNEKARSLGARNTHFSNPHGLTDPDNYTTARDLALIARYALHNPVFNEIIGTKFKVIPWPGQKWQRQLSNQNKLLWRYEGADGVKTGYTHAAGNTIVASATREGRRLIAVVLKSTKPFDDAQRLLDYGFAAYRNQIVVRRGEAVTETAVRYGDAVGVAAGNDFVLTTRLDAPPGISRQIDLEPLMAPVKKGQKVGRLLFYNNGEKIGQVGLLAKNDIVRKIHTYWWFWAAVLIALWLLRVIAVWRYRRWRRRQRLLERQYRERAQRYYYN